MTAFKVVETPLVVADAIAAVSGPEIGGLDVFLGLVRNHNDGRAVTRLEYHAYASMAQKEMARIAEEIGRELPGVKLSALHRVGSLAVGDLAVVCAAGAAHRGEAFRACRALIDRIKHRVPIWKREHGPDGPYWVGWEDARCGGEHHHDHDQ
jgi:molybdopterin synthase catalytic subunit